MPAISLDDMKVEVDRPIFATYNSAYAAALQTLNRYVRAHGKLTCVVRHPDPKRDASLFTVHVAVPRSLAAGPLRGNLRQLLESAFGDVAYEERRKLDHLCAIFGAQWAREVIARSSLVDWLEARSYEWRFAVAHYDGIRVLSKQAAFQIKLMWVDI